MGRGRRYDDDGGSKLNIKKVIAVIIALIVIIMFAIVVVKVIKIDKETIEKTVSLKYYTVYENQRWGVINSKGETIIKPSYDEMIIIPNPEKDVFIVTSNVDYTNGTYKSIAINSKGEQLFKDFEKVEALQNLDRRNNVWYTTNCLKVQKDEAWGLIDFSGKTLLNCQYDSIETLPYVKNSLITSKDGKKGLVNSAGNVIINNEYSQILALTDQYEDGYIVKNNDNKYGVIGTNKKILVPVQFEKIENMKSEDYYIIKEDGILKLFNTATEQKTNIDADSVKSINGESIVIQKSEKQGLLNITGDLEIEPKYQELTHIFGNYYIAKLDDKYGVIDNKEEKKVDFLYTNMIYRKDADFIEADIENSVNSNIIDRNFNVKLTGIVSEVNINKGYVKVREENEYKYYNFKFEEKKNTQLLTENTLFLDKKDGKYGYVNKDGIVVVNYIYDDAMEQNTSGYSAVKKDGKWGAIDAAGKVVVEPSLELEKNTVIDFIGIWHMAEDANAGYYTRD